MFEMLNIIHYPVPHIDKNQTLWRILQSVNNLEHQSWTQKEKGVVNNTISEGFLQRMFISKPKIYQRNICLGAMYVEDYWRTAKNANQTSGAAKNLRLQNFNFSNMVH